MTEFLFFGTSSEERGFESRFEGSSSRRWSSSRSRLFVLSWKKRLEEGTVRDENIGFVDCYRTNSSASELRTFPLQFGRPAIPTIHSRLRLPCSLTFAPGLICSARPAESGHTPTRSKKFNGKGEGQLFPAEPLRSWGSLAMSDSGAKWTILTNFLGKYLKKKSHLERRPPVHFDPFIKHQ